MHVRHSSKNFLKLFANVIFLGISLLYLYVIFFDNGVVSYYPVYLYIIVVICGGFILWRRRLVSGWIVELVLAVLLVFPIIDTALLFSIVKGVDSNNPSAFWGGFRLCYQNIGNEFWENSQKILRFYASNDCDVLGLVEVWLPEYSAFVGVDEKTQVKFVNKIRQALSKSALDDRYPYVAYKGEYLLLSKFPVRVSLSRYESYLDVYLYSNVSEEQPFINMVLVHIWTPLIKSPYILKSKLSVLDGGYLCKSNVCFVNKWRQYQEREVRDFLIKNKRDRVLHTLIIGDFNALPSYFLISQLARQYTKVGHLFSIPTFHNRFPAIQIDHVFARGVIVTDFMLLDTPFSDHRGLILDVSFY